jgi:hypothetical protein
MATAAEIASRRKEDARFRMLERAKLGPIQSSNRIAVQGTNLTINVAGSDGLAKDKVKALRRAIEVVAAAGHQVPDLAVYLSEDVNVQTIAFVGSTAGTCEPVVFLGGKAGKTSCKARANHGVVIEGGIGAGGRERGIADQEYDGTSRWFGNPKQLALMETTMIHELGHVLHEQHDPSTFWDLKASIVPAAVAGSGWLNAAMEVSQYATKGPLEFVAEVFAGRLLGKAYGATVNNAYTAANGP